jgi:hypothetical protein
LLNTAVRRNLRSLKETHGETETIISSVNRGREKSVAKKDLDKIKQTIQNYNDYKNHQNMIQYLKKISCHFRGKKI